MSRQTWRMPSNRTCTLQEMMRPHGSSADRRSCVGALPLHPAEVTNTLLLISGALPEIGPCRLAEARKEGV